MLSTEVDLIPSLEPFIQEDEVGCGIFLTDLLSPCVEQHDPSQMDGRDEDHATNASDTQINDIHSMDRFGDDLVLSQVVEWQSEWDISSDKVSPLRLQENSEVSGSGVIKDPKVDDSTATALGENIEKDGCPPDFFVCPSIKEVITKSGIVETIIPPLQALLSHSDKMVAINSSPSLDPSNSKSYDEQEQMRRSHFHKHIEALLCWCYEDAARVLKERQITRFRTCPRPHFVSKESSGAHLSPVDYRPHFGNEALDDSEMFHTFNPTHLVNLYIAAGPIRVKRRSKGIAAIYRKS